MSASEAVAWGSSAPPRDLATAPRAVKSRLEFSRMVFWSASGVSTFVGACLFASLGELPGPKRLMLLALLAVLPLVGFLTGRAFDQTTRKCLRDAVPARFVVKSIERMTRWTSGNVWRGFFVTLEAVDDPHLQLVVYAPRHTELVPTSTEVIGLRSRGEHLVLGLSDREVFTTSPASAGDRARLKPGW